MGNGDWDGADLIGGKIFMHIGLKLFSQPKVDASHGMLSRIFGPHFYKYFPTDLTDCSTLSFGKGRPLVVCTPERTSSANIGKVLDYLFPGG